MGFDKASIVVDGEPLGHRLARLLRAGGWEPTVLGASPIHGFGFQADAHPGSGPLAALREFVPTADFVLVLSCDVPKFELGLAEVLEAEIGRHDAALPVVRGRLQPLCALYRRSAWQALGTMDGPRVMDWVGGLDHVTVDEERMVGRGVHWSAAVGVNSPEELADLLHEKAVTMD
ncbi:MAG: NTP transferase domain-containing protein [Fimbriimonadaceae bacterium]|nr:NTP transferase domain-containing protein [Fimbriimonadaceae bacterium]